MLLPYRGEYLEAIATAKSNSKMMEKNLHLFHGNGNGPASDNASQDTAADTEPVEEDRDEFSSPIWAITIPDHVCILEKLQMWIPLDRAVFVTRAVLSFLSEKHMAILLKHIESMAMFMSSQGVLEEVDGNHTIIRAAMRRFQDMATEGVNNKPTTHLSSLDTKIIVVNLDKLLQASVSITLLN